jgi:hypothetical protein
MLRPADSARARADDGCCYGCTYASPYTGDCNAQAGGTSPDDRPWQDEMRAFIEDDQIPCYLGGTCRCADRADGCRALIPRGNDLPESVVRSLVCSVTACYPPACRPLAGQQQLGYCVRETQMHVPCCLLSAVCCLLPVWRMEIPYPIGRSHRGGTSGRPQGHPHRGWRWRQ